MSEDHKLLIGELLHDRIDATGFEEIQEWLRQAQNILQWVALLTEPADLVRSGCNHPSEIIKL